MTGVAKSRPENVMITTKSRPENVINVDESRPENVMEDCIYKIKRPSERDSCRAFR